MDGRYTAASHTSAGGTKGVVRLWGKCGNDSKVMNEFIKVEVMVSPEY